MAPPYSYEQLDGVRTLSRIDPVDLSVDLENYVPVSLVRNGVLYIILYSMLATLLFVLLCAVLLKNGLSPQKRKLPIVWVLGFSMFGALLGSTLNMVSDGRSISRSKHSNAHLFSTHVHVKSNRPTGHIGSSESPRRRTCFDSGWLP